MLGNALVDVMLPGLDGVSVCRAVRNAGANVDMILMLTARDGESDKVLGLESGADDDLTKSTKNQGPKTGY